jgi:hypothetical protein
MLTFRNKYYNLELQEVVECPLCLTETHNIEDLLPFYLTGEKITCAHEKHRIVPMGQLAPGMEDESELHSFYYFVILYRICFVDELIR